MHMGNELPRVLPTTKMPDVIYEMSSKGLGLTAVTKPDGHLLGIITDGDLRRVMQRRKQNVLELAAIDCMTKNPVTLPRTELAAAALRLMEEKEDHVRDGRRRRRPPRGHRPHPRSLDTAIVLMA